MSSTPARLAFACITTTLLLCCAACSTPAERPEPRIAESRMQPYIDLQTQDAVHRFTVEDLERIKPSLLAALKAGGAEEEYPVLADELEHRSAAMILPEGRAMIGAWTLRSIDGRATLERQQMPRAPLMLFHRASLSLVGDRWQVDKIDVVKVRGR